MTVSKICEHKELYFEIVNSSTGKTTKIIQKCDSFLIEILIEIIINTDLFYNDKNKNKGWKKVNKELVNKNSFVEKLTNSDTALLNETVNMIGSGRIFKKKQKRPDSVSLLQGWKSFESKYQWKTK
jgi:hypothetical protein